MNVRGPTIRALFAAELRMMLRDRRTIVMSIVLPLLVMPVMLFASYAMHERRDRVLADAAAEYAVTGPRAAEARAILDRLRARTSGGDAPFRFSEVPVADPRAALDAGTIGFYLDARSAGDTIASDDGTTSGRDRAGAEAPDRDRAELPPDVLVLALVVRADRDDSEAGADRMRRLLLDERLALRARVLADAGFAGNVGDVASVERVNLATEGQLAGLTLGPLLTPLLLLFLLTGSAVVAIDTLAGEKERGTLETLLTTAVSRAEIVAAKHLLILTVAISIMVIQVGNLLVYVGFDLIPTPAGFASAVTPLMTVLLLFLYLPVAALAASVLLLVSGYAGSYKEAQLYFFPLFLVALLPASAAFLPALPLRSAIVLVPIANVSVAVKDLLTGAPDWPFTAVAWAVTAGAAGWAARLAAHTLSTERLIAPVTADAGETVAGPLLFSRHVLRWFALLWAVTLIVGLNVETRLDVRLQTIVNLVVLFLGASFLMIRRYRLAPVEVLALRPVGSAVWVAVLAGVPAGMLTGIGVFRLGSLVLPVPPDVIESFTRALMPESVPLWQLLVLFTVLPGICEEIAFRGVLLHGLHRRLHPAGVALVVGLVFGLFHVSLFRILPTAFLGVIFAAVVLLTGSIFPAMVWHAGHNGLSLLVAKYEWDLSALEPGTYALATGILAAAFWIIWRNRAPYPGLRPWRVKAAP